jgi:feruloyl-CoA synthase
MLASNQAMIRTIWPILAERPPRLVDWLPWNHTFGGNFTLNLALANGGSYFIDRGKPTPALIDRTVEAIRRLRPTAYFNVPSGYDALLTYLEQDSKLARDFFDSLDFLFCAAAALLQTTRDRLQKLIGKCGSVVPILGGWGSTETAPCCTALWFETASAANIGLPLPGVTLKMVPTGDKLELRVRGPNVTPGYWRDPKATAQAFDAEGFYCIGDAGRLIDPEHAEAGISFDGRVAENFKLSSGTWVNVGALRVAIIDATRPFVQDLVVAGHDRDEIGLLLFPADAALREVGLEATINQIRRMLRSHNRTSRGGSMQIIRFLVQTRPPSPETYEITEKGYLNQRAVLKNRAAEVDRLFGSDGEIV